MSTAATPWGTKTLSERKQIVHSQRMTEFPHPARIVLTAKARRFQPVAEQTVAELGVLAHDRLGERRLASVKHGLKEWIET